MDDFEAALVGYLPNLLRYARRLTRGNREAADDLVQDCAARALDRRDSFIPGSNMRAWLFTILRNQNVNRIRRSARRPEDPVSDVPQALAADDPYVRVLVGDVEAALRRLPPEQRNSVLLVGYHGCSYEQAAEIEGVVVGTVRSRLSRGRAALRDMME